MSSLSYVPRFIDGGVNLTDPMFRGEYRGKRKHEDDFDDVVRRSNAAGVRSVIVTGGSLSESREALDLAKELGVFATAGCHPTRSSEFDSHTDGPEAYLVALDELIASRLTGPGRVVAIGECGLDYDRLHFSPADTQRTHFRSQLALAKKFSLPLFLHSRAAHADFVRILTDEGFGKDGGRGIGAKGGVVHSFTGSEEEAKELLEMGFHISINGCGLKTAENLATVKSIPLDRLMLETDAPWCSLTSGHASWVYVAPPTPAGQGKKAKGKPAPPPSNSDTLPLPQSLQDLFSPSPSFKPEAFRPHRTVKGRNEPCAIGLVAHVVASVKGVSFEEVCEAAWMNTREVFGLTDEDLSGGWGRSHERGDNPQESA